MTTPSTPEQTELIRALAAAADAHHEYEKNYLNGERDSAWAGW